MAIYNRLGRSYGFNPGFGMQTTNVEGGTETIFHSSLGAPKLKDGAPVPDQLDAGSTVVLFRTKTTNRISRFIIRNAGPATTLSFFFAYYDDGRLVYPTYANGATKCYYSLACSVAADHTALNELAIGATSIVDIWNRRAADADAGAGGTKAAGTRTAAGAANTAIFPQNYPNIGAIMEASLNAANGAVALNPKGLAAMNVIDTDVAICAYIGANLTNANASLIDVELGIIETDISARNETEEYVKSWTQIPAGGVYDVAQNSYDLMYIP